MLELAHGARAGVPGHDHDGHRELELEDSRNRVEPTQPRHHEVQHDRRAPALLDQLDGFQRNDADRRDIERQWPQLKGQFLIDRDGIVRWAHVELPTEGVAEVGKFPSDDELLAAAGSIT